MDSQNAQFYPFLDLRWDAGEDAIVFIFINLGTLKLRRRDFPNHPGACGIDEAPFALSSLESDNPAGLLVENGCRTITLDGPLTLGVYDWLGWPMPEPRRVRAVS